MKQVSRWRSTAVMMAAAVFTALLSSRTHASVIVNGDFEADPGGTVSPNITGWNLDFYTMNDFGTRGTGPNVVHELNITTARSYSGSQSVYSFIQNVAGGSGSNPNNRHATHDLLTTVPFATTADTLYLWRSDVTYTTSSRYYWRLDVILSDGVVTSGILLAGRAWGNSEGVPGNVVNTSDMTDIGSDGQTWYRHSITIPTGMNHDNLTMTIRHQQDSWDGTTAQSRLYFDMVGIPEPSSCAMLGIGIALVLSFRRCPAN